MTIKSIECAIVDKGFEEGWIVPEPPPVRTGKKVAVVGSGPAGLAAAAQLNRAGHWVTVFERADRIGGLLMYGIPNMKLDKGIVQRRVDLMEAEGRRVRRRTARSARTIPADEAPPGVRRRRPVRRRHEPERLLHQNGGPESQGHPFRDGVPARATPRACWTARRRRRPLPLREGQGRDRHRRRRHRHRLRRHVDAPRLPQPGAVRDAAQAAADERAPDNPWPQWPKVYKIDYGQEEAAAVFGDDPREYLIQTKKFVGDADGRVKELHTVRVEWVKDNGRPIPREVPGSERVFPAQLVLFAMGFRGPENQLLDQLGVEKDARTNAKAEHGKFAHERARRVRGRRHAARPEPGGVGDQRGPRRGPRVRPLADGRDGVAVRRG